MPARLSQKLRSFVRTVGRRTLAPESIAALRRLNSRFRVLGVHWGTYREAWLAPVRKDGRPDRVLDAGCGRGEVLQEFKRFNTPVEYHGIDLAVGDPTWQFRVTALADLHKLPFADASFDKIICTEVLEHVDEPAVVVAEFARVLRPGGRLFIAVPFVWHLHQEPYDRYRFSRHVLEHLLARNQLRPDTILPAGGYFTVLRYILAHPLYLEGWPAPWRALVGFPHELYRALDALIGGPLFYALDQLDRAQKLTIGYFVHASKPEVGPTALPDDPYRCPACSKGAFRRSADAWTCELCATHFGVTAGVPDLAVGAAYRPVTESILKGA